MKPEASSLHRNCQTLQYRLFVLWRVRKQEIVLNLMSSFFSISKHRNGAIRTHLVTVLTAL
jgi:hypothetical protein